jgi:hypothetical protein
MIQHGFSGIISYIYILNCLYEDPVLFPALYANCRRSM